MDSCCASPAPSPFQHYFAATVALITGLFPARTASRDLAAEARAAHKRALIRAAGTWGGYQAAPPMRVRPPTP